jgi:colanic acid/amylovoran biosynthesis glycosyltransferase
VNPSINLVLALSPRYSETFISQKIRGLRKDGFRVLLFFGAGRSDPSGDVHAALPVFRERVLRSAGLSAYALLSLALTRIRRVIRYLVADKERGRSLFESMQGLVINYHLLRHGRKGWLHFSYATLAIGRESVAQAIGARMSMSLRGYDVSLHPLTNPRCLERAFASVQRVHTISDDLEREARNQGLDRLVNVQKIPPAIDTKFFSRRGSESYSGVKPLRFLTVGRLHWKKGLEEVLMALRIFHEQNPDLPWRLHIVGDGKLRERIAYAASEIHLLDRIEFKGSLTLDEVRSEYASASIYLQYSIQEGFCNAVIEAQSMELPCIVSNAEGLPENVGNGSFGVVVPKCRPDLLAKAIVEMVEAPDERRRKLGEEARQRVVTLYDIERQRESFRLFFANS